MAASAEAELGERLLVREQFGDFGDGWAQTLGVLFQPEDRQLQNLNAPDEDWQLAVELHSLMHEGSESTLHVDDC